MPLVATCASPGSTETFLQTYVFLCHIHGLLVHHLVFFFPLSLLLVGHFYCCSERISSSCPELVANKGSVSGSLQETDHFPLLTHRLFCRQIFSTADRNEYVSFPISSDQLLTSSGVLLCLERHHLLSPMPKKKGTLVKSGLLPSQTSIFPAALSRLLNCVFSANKNVHQVLALLSSHG